MLRVPIHKAKQGMRLAVPVTHPHAPGHQLLRTGFALTDAAIARLAHLDVPEVWVRYPPLDFLSRMVSPHILKKRAAVTQQIRRTFEGIQHQANARVDYDHYRHSISDLIQELMGNPAAVIFLDAVDEKNSPLLAHSSTVAYLSLLMGLKLDAYLIRQRRKLAPTEAKKITTLGVGAMLHDIGMLKLEPEVTQRFWETRDISDPAWRRHVTLGYEMVRGRLDPSAATIVLHHHQRYDGSGFPTRTGADGKREAMAAEQIHIFCRIVAVADMFDTLQRRMDGGKAPAVQVIRTMLRPPLVRWFDPHVLRAFLRVVPPYPPGTIVRLNDGRMAVVSEHDVEDPCRPKVQILNPAAMLEEEAKPTQPDETIQTVALRDHPSLHVSQVHNRDVAKYNFSPPRFLNYVLGEPTQG